MRQIRRIMVRRRTVHGKSGYEWRRAIDAAISKGADVSVDDFVFKNWNPMENYTADLYESR